MDSGVPLGELEDTIDDYFTEIDELLHPFEEVSMDDVVLDGDKFDEEILDAELEEEI